MNSLFRYPGGKSKSAVQKKILAYKPSQTQEFREAFVGGGGIFFGLKPTTHLKKRWINDINGDLISVYEALRDRPSEFIAACRAIKPAQPDEPKAPTKTENGAKYNQRLGEVFRKFAADPNMDQALRYFFINRTVWAGRVNYSRASRLYYSNPSGWNITAKPGYLEKIAEHLQTPPLKITTGSYEPLLAEPGDDVWVYLDPPYYRDTELAATDKLYAFGFTHEQHVKLAEDIKNSKHKICLSYDNHPIIKDLYKGLNIDETSWKYSGTSQKVKTDGQELIITNYEKPGQQMTFDQEYEDIDICANL